MYTCSTQSPNPVFRRPSAGLNSFSLVEVVIAIGVASFVLISILGMMSFAGQMVQQSDKYARLANVANQALANVQSEQFAATPYGLYAPGLTLSYFWRTNYFTFEGLPTNSFNGTTPIGPMTKGIYGQQVMEPLQIKIEWPIVGTAAAANTNIIITSVVNYNSL
jgi:type II secretory pathway pseudopilin PulG